MGKISQKRRWAIAAACCVIAIICNVALTVFGTQSITTYCDYHQVITRGPKGALLVPLGFGVADTFCAQFGPAPHRDPREMPMAFSTIDGAFARQTIPPALGIAGGMVIPALLLVFSAYFVMPSERPLMRIGAILSFLPAAAFGLAFFFFLKSPGLFTRPFRSILEELSMSLILLVPAGLFMTGTALLWQKSLRPKS
jgi:hypothetical protein